MNARRLVSNRQLTIFVSIVIFAIVLLGWWVVFNVRQEQTIRSEAEARLSRSADVAIELLNGRETEMNLQEVLDRLFPGLLYAPADGTPGARHTGEQPLAASEIRPDFARLLADDARSQAIIRMFLFEGAVFVLVQLVGVAIVFGALRRETRLKRQQENFISAVTHELKSPLTSLGLFIQALGHPDLPPEKRQDVLRKMRMDTQRLDTLINNLLDAGHALTGRFRPEPERIDFRSGVAKILSDLEGYLEENQARIEVNDQSAPEVRADRRYFESIVRNLIQNAIKYATGQPVIHIRSERNASSGILVVADEGVGLARGDEKRIFEKFYRVGDEMVRKAPGSGLGLFLAREMAEAMGGSITAESPGPGQGTTFRVFLPLAEERDRDEMRSAVDDGDTPAADRGASA